MKEIEIFFKKILLTIYLLFHAKAERKDELILNTSSKILLVRLNKIGDALVTTFLVKLLKNQTGCTIDVIADKKNHFIFSSLPFVDNIYIFPKKVDKIKELKEKINSGNYDAVFDLHDDVSTTVTMFIGSLKCKNKVGFKRTNHKIFNYLVPYPDPHKYHVIERYLSFADFLKLDYDKNEIRVLFPLNNETKLEVQNNIENKFAEKKYLVGINISAGSEARFWGIERYKELISYFKRYDVNLLVIATENDRAKAEKLLDEKVELFINPDFNRFAACVGTVDFLFTPDTSIIHLASAYNIPTFGIFVKYNTENVIWYPYNTVHETVVIEDPTFENLDYNSVHDKLEPFFEKIYYAKGNS